MAWFIFGMAKESGIWIEWMTYLDSVSQEDQDGHVT